jgi:putative SOS response-associated peptidase YedK
MCGRYDQNISQQMLALYFQLFAVPTAFNNGDVRPTNIAPIIRMADDQRLALTALWGLFPPGRRMTRSHSITVHWID